MCICIFQSAYGLHTLQKNCCILYIYCHAWLMNLFHQTSPLVPEKCLVIEI